MPHCLRAWPRERCLSYRPADTRRGVVKAALKRLHFARARMVGAVMNKCDFRSNYGYGYGYGYGTDYAALEYYGYGQKNRPAQVRTFASRARRWRSRM